MIDLNGVSKSYSKGQPALDNVSLHVDEGEFVFSVGNSGSGKSTVMDAVQVVLYGSIAATFLNKAADDAKNRRSVLSYLRGAQKDRTANRENMDYCYKFL